MTNVLEINGKELLPIKDATQFVSYSRDYITRLARERKIVATHVGRQWFIDVESLKNYEQVSSVEQELRKKQLSEKRKQEQKLRTAVGVKKNIRDKKEKTLHARAVTATCFILGFGLLSGWLTNFMVGGSAPSLALVSESLPSEENVLPPADNFIAQAQKQEALPSAPQPDVLISKDIRPIGDDVQNGVLLLPHGAVTASPTKMFSDEVQVLTAENGTQVVVKVDEYGRPVGNVIPFVTVPVNQSDR